MKKTAAFLAWCLVAIVGGLAYATIVLHKGEQLNSIYILTAALCTYAIGYRFYSKWIAAKALMLDDRRATPCELHEDGKDFVKTNKWIVFGHHFAAISGPGPLVGPVLAAQFGYLPGTLWILIGVVLGGAVQDLVILWASMRRDGRSLGQMLREEINPFAGLVGSIAILSILVILLAVLALVVVNALAESSWGVFTVAATIPIAMFMGSYLRWGRVGKVMEASILGVILLLLAVWGGQYVYASAELSTIFTLSGKTLAWSVIAYGFAASILPVWLLLAPRDYLSTFMKLGTIFALAIGCFVVLPDLQMPAVSRFIDGSGPVVPGKLFPFCFITVACGAISGFHTLISSGTSPKIIARESHARSVGYGAMCLESLVAVMAMVAACTLDPGVYLSINTKASGADLAAVATNTVAQVNSYGAPFSVTVEQMDQLARDVHEHTLIGRTGGAATLAVGMAQIFASVLGKGLLGFWYHFALMFEALFILTTVDAGTRVGRYLIQDALGHFWKPLGNTNNLWSNLLASGLFVGAWGYFLLNGVADPEGGTKALWPIFGMANQLLASIALCLATTILLKSALSKGRSPAFALITLVPLTVLLAITGTTGIQKIWDPNPRIGFAAAAQAMEAKRPGLEAALEAAKLSGGAALADARQALKQNRRSYSNARIDLVVTAAFLVMVGVVLLMGLRSWLLLLSGKLQPTLSETHPVFREIEREQRPLPALGMLVLGFTLLKEVSGQAGVEREQKQADVCDCDSNAYVAFTTRKFKGINRCC